MKDRIIFGAAALGIVGLMLFPPWSAQVSGARRLIGHFWRGEAPITLFQLGAMAEIDAQLLGVEVIAVALVAFLIARAVR